MLLIKYDHDKQNMSIKTEQNKDLTPTEIESIHQKYLEGWNITITSKQSKEPKIKLNAKIERYNIANWTTLEAMDKRIDNPITVYLLQLEQQRILGQKLEPAKQNHQKAGGKK